MIVMCFLRALGELGLYYALAGTVAGSWGASRALPLLLAQSGCYALSAVFQDRRRPRLAALLPAACLLPLLGGTDRVVSLPPLAYLVCLAWRGDYCLRWERQADVFSLLWKIFLPFVPLAALFGCYEGVVSQGLPVFLAAASASILLLRSIRHGPEIYCRRAYQARNWLALALLLAGACLAGTDLFMGGMAWVYNAVVVPLLLGLAMAVGLVLAAVLPAIYRFIYHFLQDERAVITFPAGEEDFSDLAQSLVGADEDVSRRLLPALGIVAAAAAVFLLFRWLLRRRPGPSWDAAPLQGERRSAAAEPARRSVLPATYAGRVRAQYRQFLRLCRRRGGELSPSDTCAQISAKAGRWLADPEVLVALEEIYRRARYNNQASREDLAQARRLCGRLKKEIR